MAAWVRRGRPRKRIGRFTRAGERLRPVFLRRGGLLPELVPPGDRLVPLSFTALRLRRRVPPDGHSAVPPFASAHLVAHAVAIFHAAPPLLAPLAIGARSRAHGCSCRGWAVGPRAARTAFATSGAVSLALDRAAGRLAEARGPGRCPGDRRPLADLARACRCDLVRLAGRASVPSPPFGAGLSGRDEGATRRGEPSAARRGGGLPLPRGIPASSGAGVSRHSRSRGAALLYRGTGLRTTRGSARNFNPRSREGRDSPRRNCRPG